MGGGHFAENPARSMHQRPEKGSLVAILKQLLLSSCVWLLLPAALLAQSFALSQTARQNSPFSFGLPTSAVPAQPADYRAITSKQRLQWFLTATVGPKSLVGGVFAAGLGTATDLPSEYGPHWEGFGKRFGMRLTGISTGNAIDATLGAAWGEDPRYFVANDSRFGARLKNVVDLTFRAYGPDGMRHLAYARYIGTCGNNFLSNNWRAPSEADWQHALFRTAEGFGSRALSNTFKEFVPPIVRKLRHRANRTASP